MRYILRAWDDLEPSHLLNNPVGETFVGEMNQTLKNLDTHY
jgi:hypothetical protein